jgi:hypothetical protein
VKLFLTAVALLLFVGGAMAQDPAPTLARDHLLGPVKLVEAGRVDYVRDQGTPVEGKRQIVQKLSFDERGNRIDAVAYREGSLAERLVYTYDVLGRNTGYDEYYTLTNQPLRGPRKHIYTLDADGKIAEYMVYDTDGTMASRFTYQYDAKGHKLEEDFYSWTGKRTGRLVYTYDEAGHNLTQTSYNSDDVVSWKSINTYDAEGHQLEWVQYQNGVLRYKRFSKYDRESRVTEQDTVEFNAPSNMRVSHAPVPGKVTYAYDDSARTREVMTYLPSGTLKSKEIHATDERGNETAWTSVSDGWTLLFKFEYDAYGNWIKKTRLTRAAGAKEPEPQGVEYRDISYF